MPTVHREGGFSIRIYTDDHPPPHVHVIRGGTQAKVALEDGAGSAKVLANHGMSVAELARMRSMVNGVRERLLEEWRKIHGDPR